MKIVNRAEFLKLPAGTVYAKGEPWVFETICIKGESLSFGIGDWFYLNPADIDAHDSGEAAERFEEMLDLGKSYPMGETIGRDGCFDANDIFLVFEKADLEKFRGFVDKAIEVSA